MRPPRSEVFNTEIGFVRPPNTLSGIFREPLWLCMVASIGALGATDFYLNLRAAAKMPVQAPRLAWRKCAPQIVALTGISLKVDPAGRPEPESTCWHLLLISPAPNAKQVKLNPLGGRLHCGRRSISNRVHPAIRRTKQAVERLGFPKY